MTRSIGVESVGSDLEGTERDRIIRKIKRCLALGESSNSNEAEMAMRQAQAMMRAYRLSEIDIHAEAVSCETHNTGLIRMSGWQRSLANVAARAFNCEMLMSQRKGGPISFMFIGVMPAAELAAYAYDSLFAQVRAARKGFQKQYSTSRRAADDFCDAWVHAVRTKVIAFAKEAAEGSGQGASLDGIAGQSGALVLVEKKESAAIAAWIKNKHGEVKERVAAKRDNYDRMAVLHGLRAGKDAVINQAVAESRTQALLLE